MYTALLARSCVKCRAVRRAGRGTYGGEDLGHDGGGDEGRWEEVEAEQEVDD